jgi:flagellar biosynthesis/type III secretory pathway chaperone
LSRAVEEKEELLAQLRYLERKRQVLINQVAAQWNIPMKEIKLSTLAEKTNGPQSSRIRRLSASLNDLVPKIKQANEENRMLIQHCLSIVHGALGFFQHWIMPTDVYGASGQMSMHNHNGKLISGAV